MGRKRKRHSSERSHGGQSSQDQEMRVVLRLPGAFEEGEQQQQQQPMRSLHHHHRSHHHSGVAEQAPVECVVSISLPLLRQAAQSRTSSDASSLTGASEHHRHRKHKKRKKHRHSHEAMEPPAGHVDPHHQRGLQAPTTMDQPLLPPPPPLPLPPPLPKLTLPRPSSSVLPPSEVSPPTAGLGASFPAESLDQRKQHHSHKPHKHHHHHHHHHKKSRHAEEEGLLAAKQEGPPRSQIVVSRPAPPPPPVVEFQQAPPTVGSSSSEISLPPPTTPHDGTHKHKKKKKKHKHSKSGKEHSWSDPSQVLSDTRLPPTDTRPVSMADASRPSLSGKSLATPQQEQPPSSKRVRISDDVVQFPSPPLPTTPPSSKPTVQTSVKQIQKPERVVSFAQPAMRVSTASPKPHPPPPQPTVATSASETVKPPKQDIEVKQLKSSEVPSGPSSEHPLPPTPSMKPHPSPQKEMKPFKPTTKPSAPVPPPTSTPPHSHPHTEPTTQPQTTKAPQVNLSRTALKLFLKNLHHQIHKRDPEGIFSEPVTDDIAPGYSTIIAQSMDLRTMAAKIENSDYTSVSEFKADFALMCNNAMTYNAPDTVYYSMAKKLLSSGLKIIAKEVSMRPDIMHGKVLSATASRASSASPLPPTSSTATTTTAEFRLPPPSSCVIDYTSQCVCRLDLTLLRGAPRRSQPITSVPSQTLLPAAATSALLAARLLPKSLGLATSQELVSIENATPLTDQSHLTKVTVGVANDDDDDRMAVVGVVGGAESPEEVLMQAQAAAESAKENLDANRPHTRVCFVNRDQDNRTMLNFINPDTSEVDSSRPVDLSALSEQVRMGNNAATVLKTELPMMKATPVSYLMYGPFGSFAPAYDSTFATLSKMDSDLLLSSYSSEIGVSYAHSLQQFVKGTGSFVSEMADAVLNGLTNGRHSKFMEKFRSFEESERRAKESLKLSGGGGGGGRGKAAPEIATTNQPKSTTAAPEATGNKNDDVVVISPDSSSRGSSLSRQPSPAPLTISSSNGGSSSLAEPASTTMKVDVMEDDKSSTGVIEPVSIGADGVSLGAGGTGVLLDTSGGEDEVCESAMEQEDEEAMSEGSTGDSEEEEEEENEDEDEEGEEEDEEEEEEEGAGLSLGASGGVSPVEEDEVMSSSDRSCEGRTGETVSPCSPAGSEPNSSAEVTVSTLQDHEQHSPVSARLQQTSELLGTLQQQQSQRLAQLPFLNTDTGHMILPGPSREEVDTASQISQELASMTSQVRPQDVVTVAGLHKAMGISSLLPATPAEPLP